MNLIRAWVLLCWSSLLAADVSCGGGSVPCRASCAQPYIVVDVPLDRQNDVADVAATGPCEQKGPLVFLPTAAGVCQITVSFLSGAPDFVGSVTVTSNAESCCPGLLTLDPAFVAVPEGALADAATDG